MEVRRDYSIETMWHLKNSVAYAYNNVRGQPINWNIVHCFNSWSWPSTFICLISFLSIIKNNSSWIQRDCKLTRINNTLNLDRIRMKTWSNNLISFFLLVQYLQFSMNIDLIMKENHISNSIFEDIFDYILGGLQL